MVQPCALLLIALVILNKDISLGTVCILRYHLMEVTDRVLYPKAAIVHFG